MKGDGDHWKEWEAVDAEEAATQYAEWYEQYMCAYSALHTPREVIVRDGDNLSSFRVSAESHLTYHAEAA